MSSAVTTAIFTPAKRTPANARGQSKFSINKPAYNKYDAKYDDNSDDDNDNYDTSSDDGSSDGSDHDTEIVPTPTSEGLNSPGFNTPPPRGSGANNSGSRTKSGKKKDREMETDNHRLSQRAKQITYGENTQGFRNLCKILEMDPSLLKGCLPVKPSIFQKCSKRSWDGQIRKWRRALHMYDFVDFGESEEQSQAVKQKLIEQTKNPLFSPNKPEAPEVVSPKPARVAPRPRAEVKVPDEVELTATGVRVKYSMQQLFELEKSPIVPSIAIKLPEALHWLDKRFDLEDEFDDDMLSGHLPQTPSRSPGFSSPSPHHSNANNFTPGTPVPFNTSSLTPPRSTPLCSSMTPHRSNPTPCRAVSFPERTPGKAGLFA